ncbi:BC_2427 family protein [Lysinibacillus sp. NPDC056959]|uniref:BC_2427 family protein n=1 Tax=Lysinibacillus sp. NPDC056959 TaxID=3345981 RepID=UPI003638F830
MKTPWINFRKMKEISSKQKVFINCNYQIKPKKKIDHTPQLDTTCDISYSLNADFINNDLAIEKDETSLATHLNPDSELLIPPEIDVENEMNDPLNKEEADDTSPVEEEDLATHLNPASELHIPSEADVENEMNDLLNKEEADETSPVEEDLAAHLDPNSELHISSKVDVENEMNDLLNKEEADETSPVEEEGLAAHLDPNSELHITSKVDVEIDTEEMEKNNSTGDISVSTSSAQGQINSITKKSLISTHIEIDDFLHAPICGEVVKNTFDFLDLNNQLTPQLETKLFNTSTDYPEQPDCRLVHSKINEIIFLMKNDTYEKNKQTSNPSKSVVVPLHNTQSIKKGETNNHSYASDDVMHIRVPVVVGEYKIEICLEEFIQFDKGIVGVKDISNEVVLTNCRFVPSQFSRSLNNGTCTALKGKLFIEGFINQNIEYTTFQTTNAVPAQDESLIHSNQLCQNIVLELIIHMLQVQKIRVRYDSQ